jgi:2,3-bisphosphoglycerate-independent phosphoglycerate mutase
MMVVVNHVSSAVSVKYENGPVPFVISGEKETASVNKFDENILNKENNYFKSGSDLMNMFFDIN